MLAWLAEYAPMLITLLAISGLLAIRGEFRRRH